MWPCALFLLSGFSHADPLETGPPGGAHLAHMEQFGAQSPLQNRAPQTRSPAPPPDVTVYGYHPYWGPDPATLDFSRLSHLAIFNVDLNSDGTLSDTHRWTDVAGDVVPLAHAEGVSVQLCVTSFDDDVMASVLPSESRRATAIAELVSLVDAYDADGINIDFEGLDSDLKDDFTTFIQELYPLVSELTIAMPPVDWNGAYDFDELALSSDGLFIMGYGYHWTGGNPGPGDPLYGSDTWGAYSLEWSVDDYLTWGATKDKIILGLPLYGNEWPTASDDIPGSATGTGWSVIMSSAEEIADSEGREWDEDSLSPYVLRSSSQLWYDDTESIQYRIQWAVDQDLQGVGFWALGYESEDVGFWEMVTEETSWGGEDPDEEDPADDEAPVALVSASQLVYPDEPAVLDGSASYDPEGASLSYSWTQLRGPTLQMSNADGAVAGLQASEPGVYEFALVVNDGTQNSDATSIDIVVVNPGAEVGELRGCSIGGLAAGSWLSGLLLVGARRRRR
jgi:hypothetical protein